MTIATEVSYQEYTGTGLVDTYSYPFKIHDEAHLRVTEEDELGNQSALVLNSDYTVTGVGVNSGGNVVLNSNLDDGHTLYIERVVPVKQLTQMGNQGHYFAATYENALDYLVMIAQMFFNVLGSADPDLSRCLMLRLGDVHGSGAYQGNGNRITNLAMPTTATDAVTVEYLTLFGGGGGNPPPLYDETNVPTPGPTYKGYIIQYQPTTSQLVDLQVCYYNPGQTQWEWQTFFQSKAW